jgi:hypothetical protein
MERESRFFELVFQRGPLNRADVTDRTAVVGCRPRSQVCVLNFAKLRYESEKTRVFDPGMYDHCRSTDGWGAARAHDLEARCE